MRPRFALRSKLNTTSCSWRVLGFPPSCKHFWRCPYCRMSSIVPTLQKKTLLNNSSRNNIYRWVNATKTKRTGDNKKRISTRGDTKRTTEMKPFYSNVADLACYAHTVTDPATKWASVHSNYTASAGLEGTTVSTNQLTEL